MKGQTLIQTLSSQFADNFCGMNERNKNMIKLNNEI